MTDVRAVEPQWQAALAAMRAQVAERAASRPPPPEAALLVPRALLPAIELMQACLGQWRTAGPAQVPIGLDWTAVDAMARWHGLTPDRVLADRLQALEAGALDALAEHRRRSAPPQRR